MFDVDGSLDGDTAARSFPLSETLPSARVLAPYFARDSHLSPRNPLLPRYMNDPLIDIRLLALSPVRGSLVRWRVIGPPLGRDGYIGPRLGSRLRSDLGGLEQK